MSNRRRAGGRVDSDGVNIEKAGVRPKVWLAVLALALVGAFLLVGPGGRRHAEEGAAGAVPAGKTAPDAAAHIRAGSLSKPPLPQLAAAPPAYPAVRLVRKSASEPALTAAADSESQPVAPAESVQSSPSDEQPAGSDLRGDQLTGMALFPPPGTKPILRGFVVPDDFQVPEGYVRHYQATDRGQQLPPILMFHPDYQLVDERGQPIPMPKDLVVPPELLPPGMSAQRLEVTEEPPEEAPDVSVSEEDEPQAQDPQP